MPTASQEHTIALSLFPVQTADAQVIQENFERIVTAFNQLGIYWGNGIPEGNVTASKGAIYRRFDGGAGTSFYVKESGTNTNTGWVGK